MIFEILLSTLRVSTPLMFAAMAGLICERSGIINIALEGLMLIGAFSAAATAFYLHSAWAGFFLSGLVGIFVSSILGWLSIQKKADQVVSGMAINLLMFGIIPFISKIMFNSTGSTPSLALDDRFTFEPVVFAFLLVFLVYIILAQTRLGLWISFAGEKPDALTAHGVSVQRTRWITVLASGTLAAWGGASLSLFLASAYSPQMTGGRGFMALAALILGRWKPFPVLAACLFFGITDALQMRMQGAHIFGVVLPVQWIQMLPYLVTVIALGGFLGRSRPPQALGK